MKGHIAKKTSPRGTRYYPVVELGIDPTTGKRTRRWHEGHHALKKDATQALRDILGAADKGMYVEPSKETFGRYLERWLPTIRSTVRANTFER